MENSAVIIRFLPIDFKCIYPHYIINCPLVIEIWPTVEEKEGIDKKFRSSCDRGRAAGTSRRSIPKADIPE